MSLSSLPSSRDPVEAPSGITAPSGVPGQPAASDASDTSDGPDAAIYRGAPAHPPRTLLDVLEATVTAHADAPALDTGEEVIDYRTLWAEVGRRAERLAAHGIGPGDRVGIRVASGTAELYLSILAVLRSGAAYVPVDADDPEERAASVFGEAGVCAVLNGAAEPLLSGPVGDYPPPSSSDRSAPSTDGSAPPRTPSTDDDAWIIFTSGSTGAPKGVAVTHRAAAAFVDAEAELFLRGDRPLGPGDRVLAGLSVAFDASCEEMWLAWRSGACLVPASRSLVRAGHELGPWLVERGITVVSTVPTLAALWPDEALAAVRLLIVGGEACPAGLVERFATPGREMWNTYGPTETTVVACAERLLPQEPVRIGLPLDGWDLAVVDADGTPVPYGAQGELIIAGAGLARYLDLAKDSERFVPCPALDARRAYRTGDLVRAEPEGLFYVGRADDQVKVGGRRIELGEIDAALADLDGVRSAAAAVRTTPSGGRILVGYVVPETRTATGSDTKTGKSTRTGKGAGTTTGTETGFRPDLARKVLADRLPAALVPVLAEVAELPTRTSGKVDRDALPWPLPAAATDRTGTDASPDAHRSGGPDADAGEDGSRDGLTGTAARLADAWQELLGVRPGADSDFFALGGGSLSAAQLASRLRADHPGVSVADLYRRPVLRDMAAYLDSLTAEQSADGGQDGQGSVAAHGGTGHPDAGPARSGPARREPSSGAEAVRPVPRRTGAVQMLIQLLLYGVAGLRGAVALAAADNVLWLLAPQTWVPHTSWWLVIVGWLVLMSAPSRFAIGALAARALTRSITPGAYPRGGQVHMRLWAAERTVAAFGVPALLGTPWARLYARALGCRVGADVALHAMPPVTGLAELGERASVEPEADLSGWWLDGDVLRVGSVSVGAGARVGHRSTLLPGAALGPGAELAPGGCLGGTVPAHEVWEGSPARPAEGNARTAGTAWPDARPAHSRLWTAAYGLTLAGLPVLPLLAMLPALAGVYWLVRDCTTLHDAALRLFAAAPVIAVVTTLCWILLVAAVVRMLGRGIRPGTYPVRGPVAWRAWLVTRLLNGARSSLFPIYASLATPLWLRLLGARVGRHAEISTVLPLPSLLSVADGAFLADDTLVAPYELRGGWLRLGTSHIGRRAFVGNSGIVGPDREVPDQALIGVLSDAPERSEPGSSWLGRPALPLPRTPSSADPGRTFEPPRKLVLARAAVESCRVLPLMCSMTLAEAVLVGEQGALKAGGIGLAALMGALLLLAAGLLALLTATAAKWLLVGRFRTGEHPLWSSFVWRNELYDTFVESLAVPWMAGAFTGTPVLNWWLRSLGARIGRGVWCDTYWLPETDLITLGDGVSVNRGCVLQTHLFHDRIMRLDTVHMAAGSSLGPHGITLPGTTVGERAAIGPASLVMRGESVPAGTRWAGNPIAGERPAAVTPPATGTPAPLPPAAASTGAGSTRAAEAHPAR
ncbi:Pls/PosA family non-ribosomal peptide synthetase [Streptomyces sp. MST-110588]|uniref:Pls/PosA family non-ribosomal peptide synthetase n=1 Tax=Streptomyces sp. MST-110588 TaxID=2833628 RepID=UPI001F5C2C21|nr:Pls/PosA family non-ribosomal peptide synthetase [Streptomyces sp. MST-110588]UNO40978.1 amino acid adenylation domain-containing protein [Streptomyces sp. MST-110588]